MERLGSSTFYLRRRHKKKKKKKKKKMYQIVGALNFIYTNSFSFSFRGLARALPLPKQKINK